MKPKDETINNLCINFFNYLDGEVLYGREPFEFDGVNMITCRTIRARVDDISDGTQSSRLVIGVTPQTSVPVEFRPRSIPIIIKDNDGEHSYSS